MHKRQRAEKQIIARSPGSDAKHSIVKKPRGVLLKCKARTPFSGQSLREPWINGRWYNNPSYINASGSVLEAPYEYLAATGIMGMKLVKTCKVGASENIGHERDGLAVAWDPSFF